MTLCSIHCGPAVVPFEAPNNCARNCSMAGRHVLMGLAIRARRSLASPSRPADLRELLPFL